MTTLYIIGNGFDLHHHLPTNYDDFYGYASETLNEVAEYYLLEFDRPNPWHDFENALGHFNPDDFLGFHNMVNVNAENFRPRDIYGLEDEIVEQTQLHVRAIEQAFFEWVHQINIAAAEPIVNFPSDARFINFNYTSTLQSTYSISDERVFHIHGRADTNDSLIFGHGEVISEPREFDEDGEPDGGMFLEAERAARYPLRALKKDVGATIRRNQLYFDCLSDISKVVVIGHSLSHIDLPYFQEIVSKTNNVNWQVYYHSEPETISFHSALTSIGISSQSIEFLSTKTL